MPSNTAPNTPILAIAQSIVEVTPHHRPKLEERQPPAFASDATRTRFEAWNASVADMTAANAAWQEQVEDLRDGGFRERILDPAVSPTQLRKIKRDVENATLLALRRLQGARVELASVLATLLDENTAALAAAKVEMDEARAAARERLLAAGVEDLELKLGNISTAAVKEVQEARDRWIQLSHREREKLNQQIQANSGALAWIESAIEQWADAIAA